MSQIFNKIDRRLCFATPALALSLSLFVLPAVTMPGTLYAQTQAASKAGTVKSIEGSTVTITTAAGTPVTVTLAPEVKVQMIKPGEKLDQATTGQAQDITVGDKIIAVGRAGETPDTITAGRVILMKATAIAARDQAEQADWTRRGVGGIVKSVNGNVITISSGAKTITIDTTPSTVFHKYAEDSVAFKDAKPSTIAEIRPGDQLRARGAHSADNSSITAEEIVDGSFANLSGILTSVDPANGTVTFKDLTTKKPVTVKLTANSEIKKIDPTASARFLGAGERGAGAGERGAGAGERGAGAGERGAGGGQRPGGEAGGPPSGGMGGGGSYQRAGGGAGGYGGGANRGADLSRMIARLPSQPITALKPGDAVMVVATEPSGSKPYTAITLLAGVEQILAAKPANGEAITLQPWNIGESAMPAGGGMGGPGGQ